MPEMTDDWANVADREARRMSTKKFSEIRRPEDPERRARINTIKEAMAASERLETNTDA